MNPTVVLFDLDGTLTESAPGITRSVAYALDGAGLPPLEDAALLRFIGPPLIESFQEIAGLDEASALEALVAYRRYFTERGMFENSVYPGIPALLRTLLDTGRRLAVATSKPKPYAVPIMEHFALREYFELVCGPELDGVGADKTAVVADALASLNVVGGPNVVVVGDRFHDVIGAHANGVPCIGALWGYGSREELTAAGADALAADVDELAVLFGVSAPSQGSVGDEALA